MIEVSLEGVWKKKVYRIVLADDHPLMRESIATYVADHCRGQIEVVSQVGDGLAAVQAVEKLKPDLILIDIGVPRLDGVSAIRQIKKSQPEVLVLVLPMYEDQAHVVEAIRAGADDYLFKKSVTAAQISAQMVRALGGELPAQDSLQKRLFQAIRGAQESSLDIGLTRLTGAELEILRRIAHKGMSIKEIAEDLGESGGGLSENTVRKHMEHVYEKLGATGQAHAVCLAIKYGFISPDEAEPRPPPQPQH